MVEKNLRLLTISGEPSAEELHEAWETIKNEFIDLVKNKKTEGIHEVWKRIVKTKWKMAYVKGAMDVLVYGYVKEIADRLELEGFIVMPVEENGGREAVDAYYEQLQGIRMESKALEIFLAQAETEYNLLCPVEENRLDTEKSEMDYEEELQMLTRFQGVRIDKERDTVFTYLAIVNNFYKEIEYRRAKKTTV